MAIDGSVRLDDPAALGLKPDGSQASFARPEAKGALEGLRLKVASDPKALLADAAEELTFSVDNTEELELKERQERKSLTPDLIQRVKLYQELMELNGRNDHLAALRASLKSASSASHMRDRALALFGDPAEAYAALSELAESEGDPAAKKLANQAMELIWDQSGPVISASLAGALAGADFPDLGSPLELKSEYVRAAIDFPAPLEMLQDVLKRFGPEGLERGLDYLLKALAADLAAETPSRDKASLTAVSSQLGQVRVLNGVRALGQSLADRWRGVHGQERSRLEDMDFLKFVLEGSREAYPSASLADPLVSRAAPPDIEKETLFRQDLLASVKKVSIEAFGDLDRRERLVGAVQEGLDQAIEREDEWLASLEESQ